jgi:hypothetical protein
MANSKLSLINNALILIGDVPLTSLTSGTRAQVVATSLYDNIIDNELSKHRWGFARNIAQLSKDVAATVGDEWQTSYTLPADMLALIKINPSVPYQIISNKVYCNYSGTLFCDYIRKPSEADWPAYFAKMIEYALGMDFAPSIRDSAASMELLANQYLNASRMARFTDSQQHPQTPIQDRPFINVRY